MKSFFESLVCRFKFVCVSPGLESKTDIQLQRRAWVQELRRVASCSGTPRLSDNANRRKIQEMAEAVLGCATLSPQDRESALAAWESATAAAATATAAAKNR